jgi:hypothetical protein
MIAPTKARLIFRIKFYRITLVVRQTPRGRNQDAFSTKRDILITEINFKNLKDKAKGADK